MPKTAWADYETQNLGMAQTSEQTRIGTHNAKRRIRQRRFGGRHAGQVSCDAAVAECEAMTKHVSNVTTETTSGLGMNCRPLSNVMEEMANKKVYSYNGTLPTVEDQNSITGGSPLALVDNQELCNEVIQRLEEGDKVEKLALLLWFHKETRKLALSKCGCRVVQKALEVTGGSDRDLIIAELKDHVTELYESPNGNHVLSRAIEVLPAAKYTFIISSLLGRGLAVSKHRFGCRVVCRLIEHGTEEHIGAFLDEVLGEAAALARHAFGNFVVQTSLEHTSHARRSTILMQLLPDFPTLATHRTGSLVAQRVFDFCNAQGQDLALRALLYAEGEHSIVEVACSHYGSYVVEQLAGFCHMHHVAQEIRNVLANNLQRLCASEHAQRVAIAFMLVTAEQI